VTQFSALIPALAFVGIWGGLLCYQPIEGMSPGVLVWWSALCAVSILNIWAWRLSAVALARQKAETDLVTFEWQRWQLFLCAAYVFGCAFRCLLPRADVQRIGLFDTWVSSVLVGRSVATVAELCFAAQWGLWLRHIARTVRSPIVIALSWLLVPMIAVAEICSWYAVLTTAYVGNMIEESIWAGAGFMLVIGCLAVWPRCHSAVRTYLAVIVACGLAYVVFMCAVDVPMYSGRWLADEAHGRAYLSLGQGLWDAGSRLTITNAWEEWRAEIPWMSLYFSAGVWSSITLVHLSRYGSLLRNDPEI
jgi:hypothetical protein